jgi:hypothetical protein
MMGWIKMTKKKYSEVINHEGRKFRYNQTDCVLEWLDKKHEVVDSIGLSRDYAELALMDYIFAWNEDINQELAVLRAEFGLE